MRASQENSATATVCSSGSTAPTAPTGNSENKNGENNSRNNSRNQSSSNGSVNKNVNSSTNSSGTGSRSAVYLRVYDISGGAAKIWSPIVLGRKVDGVWHSGVEVFGYEYFYGGGIVKMLPDNVEDTFGISPTRIHHLGYTTMMRNQFEKHLIAVMPMFSREVYDLVNWNCNHFSEHATRHLVDRGIPSYILDLPHEICKTFMGKIVLNFFKMLQGGSAPVTIDDPQHPSRVLGKSARRNGGPRRNSCPPTPSVSHPGHTESYKINGFENNDDGPSLSNFSTANNIVNGSTKTSIRSTQRRRTHTANSTVVVQAAAAAAASAASAASSETKQPSAKKLDRNRTSSSSAKTSQSVTFKNSLPIPENDRNISIGMFDETNVKTIMGGKLQDRTDTQLVFSPRHKRLYELERDKYAIHPNRQHTNTSNNSSINSSINHHHHRRSRNSLDGNVISTGCPAVVPALSHTTVRRVSHGGRNVPTSTRRTVIGQRSYSVGPKNRYAPSVR